jgi:hypothetical protein
MTYWRPVVFAAEVDPDTDECPCCGGDYADCPCPGPTMDGYEYEEHDGILYARPTFATFERVVPVTDVA